MTLQESLYWSFWVTESSGNRAKYPKDGNRQQPTIHNNQQRSVSFHNKQTNATTLCHFHQHEYNHTTMTCFLSKSTLLFCLLLVATPNFVVLAEEPATVHEAAAAGAQEKIRVEITDGPSKGEKACASARLNSDVLSKMRTRSG